ncbi:MAG: cytochrome c4 [Rubrivivax sp.]|nr:cytochrome c4 [Rubrivivax sp.]
MTALHEPPPSRQRGGDDRAAPAPAPAHSRLRLALALLALAAAASASGAGAAGAAGNAAAARADEIVSGKCFVCHGADGESSSPIFPRLAGQHSAYIARQLADYKSGRRKSTTMQPMVDDLAGADFTALGAYFAAKPVHAHAVEDPELAGMGRYIFNRGNPFSGVAACSTCHGAAGHGTETLPRLAGQHALYTENQLKQFNKRERTNDNAVMHAIASKLTELEMKAVAAYISGLK